MSNEVEIPTPKGESGPKNTRVRGISRRRMILVSTGGALLAIPGISAICRWANTPTPIRITLKGPFRRGAYVRREQDFKVSHQARWFSIDGLSLGFVAFEPSADLHLILNDTSDFPKKPFQIRGRIIGDSGQTLAEATEVYDPSNLSKGAYTITVGMTKARVESAIDHCVHWVSNVRIEDMATIEWEITFA